MQDTQGLLEQVKQHEKLAIRVSSHANNHLQPELLEKLLQPHRKSVYFFAFVDHGSLTHRVDLDDLTISNGQLLFVLPNQIHTASANNDNIEYFKLLIDKNCLSLLPKQYPFFINPLSSQIITFDSDSRQRVKMLFIVLDNLLHAGKDKGNAEIIVAHLNSLLTEFNNAYFRSAAKQNLRPDRVSKFVAFKAIVEEHLTEQYSINTIAATLHMSTNNLYSIVKEFSGISPKEFITNRLMLEAQRRLYYSRPSIKELAYELGFGDPDYFSRLFKKSTGKSLTDYLADFKDLSGK